MSHMSSTSIVKYDVETRQPTRSSSIQITLDGDGKPSSSAAVKGQQNSRLCCTTCFSYLNKYCKGESSGGSYTQSTAPEQMVKILVLGPGGSGKSTVLKQMRLIHGEKFEKSERQRFLRPIVENILQSVCHLVEAMHKFSMDFKNEDNLNAYNSLLVAKTEIINDCIDWFRNRKLYCVYIKDIWNDETIKLCYEMRNKFYLHDSTKYFMDHIDRITSDDYLPTIDDILRVREPTTAIVEHRFKVKDTHFLFVDIGGQRSERKKWIHCFDAVTTIMFVASLSDYDTMMTESETRGYKSIRQQNRLHEALDLFKTLINWKRKTFYNSERASSSNRDSRTLYTEDLLFKNAGIVLYLNKEDLFDEKIRKSPLSVCFSDFDDQMYDNNERGEKAKDFIATKFIQCNEIKSRNIYWHYTYALDRESMKVITEVVKEKIIEDMLRNYIL